MPYRHVLGALSGGHVADVVVQMGGGALRAALEVGALEYDAGHGASPSSSQPMVGPLIRGRFKRTAPVSESVLIYF